MSTLFWIILSTFSISLIAIVAIFGLYIKHKLLDKILLTLLGLSAGAMIGGAFLHLIPEAIEKIDGPLPFLLVIVGFTLFFLMEKVLHWRHCHKGNCDVHPFGYLNLIGDSFHNFLDGLIIAAAFIVDIRFGIVTTFAVAIHEIPQEIGDFGVLIYSGFNKFKALVLNYIVATMVILGGIAGYFLGDTYSFTPYALPIAAGGFLYIAASDLLPELRKENGLGKFIGSFLTFLLGIGIMYLLTFLE